MGLHILIESATVGKRLVRKKLNLAVLLMHRLGLFTFTLVAKTTREPWVHHHNWPCFIAITLDRVDAANELVAPTVAVLFGHKGRGRAGVGKLDVDGLIELVE